MTFLWKEPDEGAAPSDTMQVTFLYDDTALYVGAHMSSEHASIPAPLGRRDDVAQSEFIVIALDTYLDHRSAYGLGVTASGVRLDRYYPADAEEFDATIEPVWEACTRGGRERGDGGDVDPALTAAVQRARRAESPRRIHRVDAAELTEPRCPRLFGARHRNPDVVFIVRGDEPLNVQAPDLRRILITRAADDA